MSAPFTRFTRGRHGSHGLGLRVYGFTLVSIPHTVHMVSIVCPPPYPSMGSPVCGLTGLHWYNASSLYEGQTWFTWSGFTGLRGYTPLHSSRCSHGLRRLPPLPIHGFTIHMVCTSNMVDMVCMVYTGNMTPHSWPMPAGAALLVTSAT